MENRTYFKIGIFMLAALAVLIGGILYINADVIRGEAVLIETYIDESVQGLAVGSQVLYRGVAIGQVKEITFIPLVYDLEPAILDKYGRYVMVLMAIKSDYFPGVSGDPRELEAVINHQVNSGLRFKLSYQGITGIVYMEADYFLNAAKPQELPWEPHNLYVPSVPSVVTSFTAAVEKIFLRIENIDIEAIFTKFERLLDTTNKSIEDAKIAELREGVLAAVSEFNKTNQQFRKSLEGIDQIPDQMTASLKQFEQTLAGIENLVARNEPDLQKIIIDLKDLMQNMKRFSEDLKSDPAQIIFSRPPKPSERVK